MDVNFLCVGLATRFLMAIKAKIVLLPKASLQFQLIPFVLPIKTLTPSISTTSINNIDGR
jgi:hypothetical protein